MSRESSQLAFVFPGQGSQSPGMLAELAARHPQVADTFVEASDAIGADLWAMAQAADDPRLNQTEYTQPALLAGGLAVWRVWQAQGGVQPAWLAGHSLGEYTALVAADALSLADGVRLVHERGRLMQAAVPAGVGAMAAVLGADDATIAEACAAAAGDEVVVPANYNSPGQTVIGGHVSAVDRATAALAERGIRKVVKLPVSVPSHTPLMADAARRLADVMADLDWRMPTLPVLHNVDALPRADIDGIRQALVSQLHQPVRWIDCVMALANHGVVRIGECGPGKVLTGLVKRIDKQLDARSLATPDDFDAALSEWSMPAA